LGVATAVIGAFFTDWAGKKKSEPAPEPAEAAKLHQGFSIQPWVAIGGGASVGALGRF
jgi:thiamine monophosphate synthase